MRERLARITETPVVAPNLDALWHGSPPRPEQIGDLRDRLQQMTDESRQVHEVASALLDLPSHARPAPTETILL